MSERRHNDVRLLFPAIIICAVILWLTPALAFADNGTEYIDASGQTQIRQDCDSIEGKSTLNGSGQEGGWYYASGKQTIEGRIQVSGNVHLILCDNASVAVPSGIQVPAGSSLTIYAQSEGENMGSLGVSAASRNAGIGGYEDHDSGPITINGGKITAQGGKYAAGIGGGDEAANGPITINGGDVTARGGDYGAAIGSGDQSNPTTMIRITGGKVTAYGGYDAAGIGSGNESHVGEILIEGGEIASAGGYYGAGIGGGDEGNGGKITITDGTIKAYSGGRAPDAGNYFSYVTTCKVSGAGIGGGRYGNAGSITITGGTIRAQGSKQGAGIGTGGENDSQKYTGSDSEGCLGGVIRISGGNIEARGRSIWDDEKTLTLDGGAGIGSGANSFGCLVELTGGDIKTSVSCCGSRVVYIESIQGDGGAGIGNGYKAKSPGIVRIRKTDADLKIHVQTMMTDLNGGHYDKTVAIGAVSGVGEPCQVSVDYPHFKVRTGGNKRPEKTAGRDQRMEAIQGHTYIWIEPCDHKELKCIDAGEDGHTFRCENCEFETKEKEAHQYKPGVYNRSEKEHWQICEVCGYGNHEEHSFGANGICACGMTEGGTPENAHCNITFDSDGGSEVQKDTVVRGYPVNRPEDPVREGYVFAGWRLMNGSEIAEEDYDFANPVISDITLKAVWECDHKLKAFPLVEPGCDTDGNAPYWQCSECGKYFSDADGTTEYTEGDWIIGARHEFKWEGASDAQHIYKCSKCGYVYEPATGDHIWNDGTVTAEEPEIKTFTCIVCGAVKTETVALSDTEFRVLPKRIGAGTVTVSDAKGKEGDKINIQAEPAEGFVFSGWEIQGKDAVIKDKDSASTKLTIGTANVTITAIFDPVTDADDPAAVDPTPTPTPTPTPADQQMGEDGTAVGKGASAAAAEKAILSSNSEEGPAGTKFAPLRLKSTRQTKNSVKLAWTKVNSAEKYVIYGNLCGKTKRMKKIGTATGTSKTIRKAAGRKLRKGKYYKFIIVALDRNNKVVSTSKVVHVATKGGKVGNHKKVTVRKSVINKAKKLSKGKSLKLNAKLVKASSKLKVRSHRKISYESSNTKIATVSRKGVVKGKEKGTCYIYAYAQNGVYKKIKVTVK